jgi:hypothetical protein
MPAECLGRGNRVNSQSRSLLDERSSPNICTQPRTHAYRRAGCPTLDPDTEAGPILRLFSGEGWDATPQMGMDQSAAVRKPSRIDPEIRPGRPECFSIYAKSPSRSTNVTEDIVDGSSLVGSG